MAESSVRDIISKIRKIINISKPNKIFKHGTMPKFEGIIKLGEIFKVFNFTKRILEIPSLNYFFFFKPNTVFSHLRNNNSVIFEKFPKFCKIQIQNHLLPSKETGRY